MGVEDVHDIIAVYHGIFGIIRRATGFPGSKGVDGFDVCDHHQDAARDDEDERGDAESADDIEAIEKDW